MSRISVDNISLKFRVYSNGSSSLKESFSNLWQNKKLLPSNEFYALQGISFDIEEGARVGIIGNNGAGKSTLLRVIADIYRPTSGSISTTGKIAPLLDIGAGFHPEFTGRENIYYNGSFLNYDKESLRAVEKEVIAFAELEEFIDVPVKYYSTGMYMRLAFSLATTVKPDILIADELFVGGDASFIERGKERMNNMINSSKVMLLVSHDANLIRSLCDTFIWIDKGRMKAIGGIEVLNDYVNSGA